jgi:hypothetical protein
MKIVSGVIDLSQRLKTINHIPCGELDPKDFAHYNYVTLPSCSTLLGEYFFRVGVVALVLCRVWIYEIYCEVLRMYEFM